MPKGRGSMMPTTGAKPEYNGLHPERIKELQNEGERQAEEQIEQPSSPFQSQQNLADMPPEEDDDTLPDDTIPAGMRHQNVRRQLPPMGAAHQGPIPRAEAASGGMRRNVKRGGSAFYGD